MLQFRHSDETKRLISASKLGRDPWNKGVPMKDAQKVKLSVKATGRKRAEAVKEQLSAAFRKSWAEGKRAKPVVPPLKKKSLAMQSPIMDLAAEGISLTEIGRRLGMRRHTVARIVRLTSTA
jgi:DNA-binding NarL/FixJ family response regulator